MFHLLTRILGPLFLVGSLGLLVIAIAERIANVSGYTIIRQAYTAGRLAEFAAICAVFLAALLLWQVRDELRKRGR